MDTKELGNLGERIACEYLVKKGFKILGKNYRISFGEIDIIARKKFKFFAKNDKTIHFVEVKTIIQSYFSNRRPSTITDMSFFPEERVGYKKQRKLIGLCQIWLEKNKLSQNHPYQIDIIGILIDQNSKKAKINYFQNVVEDIN